MKIAFIIGTRPEIIKMSPLIRRCIEEKIKFILIHTNQHYTETMDKVFFDDLELPQPDYNLNVGSGSHGYQTGTMLIKIEPVLIREKPNAVLVQGDTNTVLAGGLTASKLGIKVGHVEAGLRSYDRDMPEELNRILCDHVSDYLFCPTPIQEEILLNEGIKKEKIFVTGNTIVDAVMDALKIAEKKSSVLEKLGLEKNNYFSLTMHRPSNVDFEDNLKSVFGGLSKVSEEYNQPIIYPVHPRTMKNILNYKIEVPETVRLIDPLPYLDFLVLLKYSRLVLTDSGGIQEECCIMKIPCVTLRDNTERPETLHVKSNILAGSKPDDILRCTQKMLEADGNWCNPFGDGTTAEQIIQILHANRASCRVE